jgi:hypothetical protein
LDPVHQLETCGFELRCRNQHYLAIILTSLDVKSGRRNINPGGRQNSSHRSSGNFARADSQNRGRISDGR